MSQLYSVCKDNDYSDHQYICQSLGQLRQKLQKYTEKSSIEKSMDLNQEFSS